MHWASDSPASIQPHCARISVTDFCRASALLGKYGAYSVGFPSPRALIQTGIILTCIFLPNLSDIITDKRPSHCWQRNAFPACVRVKSSWRSPVQHKMWYVDYPPFYYKKKQVRNAPLLLAVDSLWAFLKNKQTNKHQQQKGIFRISAWIDMDSAGSRAAMVGDGAVNFTAAHLWLDLLNASSPSTRWDSSPPAEGTGLDERHRLVREQAYRDFTTTVQVFILLGSLIGKSAQYSHTFNANSVGNHKHIKNPASFMYLLIHFC